MSKSSKKSGKVPKITEAEYAEYIASLKEEALDFTSLGKARKVETSISKEE